MLIGAVAGIAEAGILKSNHFDYIELNVTEIASFTAEEFCEYKKKVEIAPAMTYSFCVLLPGDISVVGENVNYDIIEDYIKMAFGRIRELGGKIVVFGSGGSRRVPDGFPRDKAFSQLVVFLKLLGRIAKEHNITIAIEPLRSAETNMINTVKEGLELVKAVDYYNVGLLVDFYHMSLENDGVDIIRKIDKNTLKHAHIANPNGRAWPKASDSADYVAFFDALKSIGYEGGISVEAVSNDIESDCVHSNELLRKLM